MPFRYIALPPKESTEVEGEESTKKSRKAKKLEPLLPPGMLELLKKDNDTALDLF